MLEPLTQKEVALRIVRHLLGIVGLLVRYFGLEVDLKKYGGQ